MTIENDLTKDEAYKLFAEQLGDNPLLLEEKRRKFEMAFGKDTESRTKMQWQNLCRVYGIKQVAEIENMTISEVSKRCVESKLRRELRLSKQSN